MDNQNTDNYYNETYYKKPKSNLGKILIIIIIITIAYGLWNAETENKISLIIEKPNQKVIIIENEEIGFDNIPKRIGIGNTYNEATQNSVNTDQLLNYLVEYFYEQSDTLFE